MKKWIVSFLLVVFALCAQAQLAVPISDTQAQAEQKRIHREREKLEVQTSAQEVVCYQRFAVNDCLREFRVRKRVGMDALRQQEIVLNDAKRKTRDMERSEQAQDKNSAAALKQAQDRKESAQIQHKERLDRAQQKKFEATQRDMPAQTDQGPEAGQASLKGERAQAQQAFDEKQRLAQERKAQRDKSLTETSSKPANPLPARP